MHQPEKGILKQIKFWSKNFLGATGKFSNLRMVALLLMVAVLSAYVPKWLNQNNWLWAKGDSGQIEIWWPNPKTWVGKTEPLKALTQNWQVEKYNMYWQVDGGQWNYMDNNFQDYPHKETVIDFTSWNWRGNGPYSITIKANDAFGNEIGKKTFQIYVSSNQKAASTNSNLQKNESSLKNATLFKGTNYQANKSYLALSGHDNRRAELVKKIADQPQGIWLGNWNLDVKKDIKYILEQSSWQGGVPVFVLYNLPLRDCGGHSNGGVKSRENYDAWIKIISDSIKGQKTAVILEPDSLSMMNCLDENQQNERYAMLASSINTLKNSGQTAVYLDAGHSAWLSAEEITSRLQKAGLEIADGFALNVSNFRSTGESVVYGKKISNLTNNKHFILDTSRSGKGPAGGEWCNPWGVGLGEKPTTSTGDNLIDAFLWIKNPGESDGQCNGGPQAGVFWVDYAVSLAQNANW